MNLLPLMLLRLDPHWCTGPLAELGAALSTNPSLVYLWMGGKSQPEEDRELGRLGEEMGMHCGETDARPLNGTGGGGDPAAKSAKSPMEYFASMGLIAGPQQLPIAR